MGEQQLPELTELLAAWSDGDRTALDRLTPLVDGELRRLAHHYMSRERDGHTLQTTALVNEAYIKLAGQKEVQWESRSQFYGLASRVMRNILVDHARGRARAIRGGGAVKVPIDDIPLMSAERAGELVALDEALGDLEKEMPRKAKIVELRYFGGFSVDETASVLDISTVTVMRDWSVARAWLLRRMTQ